MSTARNPDAGAQKDPFLTRFRRFEPLEESVWAKPIQTDSKGDSKRWIRSNPLAR